MNWARGLFRLWVLFAALVVLLTTVFGYDPFVKEFAKAAEFEKWSGRGILLLPVDCKLTRGQEGEDFTREADGPWSTFRNDPKLRLCWYDLPKMRKLFPEYEDLGEDDLAEKVYAKAGMAIERGHPWRMLGRLMALMIVLPASVLGIGTALYWALKGFRRAA